MLIHLHVKNLALIEEIDVDFDRGLNILTGETGAGKSILLGSIQLILGGKVSRNLIRQNANYALVELLFQVENSHCIEILKAMGVEPEDGQILLSRRIKDGRSINKINGEICTLSQMKACASCLLDLHGQHEHQTLLHREKQLEILDIYGGAGILEASQKVKEIYSEYCACRKELNDMDLDEEQRNREIAFLEFEVQQIQEAMLVPGEDEEVEKRYRRLFNSRRIGESLQEVHGYTGYENGAGDGIGSALHELQKIVSYDEEIAPLLEELTTIDSMMSDFHRSLSAYMDDMTFDEEAFFETEERLNLINNLKAKYGRTIEEIQAYGRKQEEKLENMRRFEEILQIKKEQLQDLTKKLEKAGEELSVLRKKSAVKLEQEIREELKSLNFLDVRFAIRFSKSKCYTAHGTDEVEYDIATNPGEEMKPLGEIVSGGELSRIMLAIKVILAEQDEIDTLIFDEIDTGISGRTAQKVSEKMADIGRYRQVLCITHLPQIASMADLHFEIEKHGNEQEGTTTEIHLLDEEQSVVELARLLGGAEITSAVLENAKEMKKLAKSRKHRD
ncbi:MAG: DNA repair protein RecN [Eubacteriales bacterium]|nr:DNA repair protein RecN [Eubacteriales bacterium]